MPESTPDPAPPTFYKTIIQVEVLSEGPFEWNSLEDVAYAIDEGPCVGRVLQTSAHELNEAEVSVELNAMGSDPGFFEIGADDAGALDERGEYGESGPASTLAPAA